MHKIRLEQRMSAAFMLAGALMVVGTLIFGWLMVTSGSWSEPQYVLAVCGLAVIAGAAGLLGMQQALQDRMPRFARVGAAVSILGALSALLLLALVVVWLIEPLFYPQTFRMDIVALLLVVSLLVMLAAMFLALVLVGGAAFRVDVGGHVVGPLLFAGGLFLLVPLAYILFPEGRMRAVPEWLFLTTFAIWAAIFVSVGFALRSYDPAHTGLGAKQIQ